MTLSAPALPLVHVNTVLVALLLVLPSLHAAERNHDLQAIRIPAAFSAVHDRAPGPVVR